jgi:hypothetical protein
MNNVSVAENSPVNNLSTDNNNRNWLSYLPMLLRGVGAIAILISMYTFLAKGWDSSTDVVRYLFLLGHTVALTAIGIASAKIIKETKGARLLLMLALVSVPINFAILGAFIFAGNNINLFVQYPQYLTWSIDSLSTALTLAGGSIFLLIPIALIGFRVLARNVGGQSSLFFLISNALLLLPFRDPSLVALFALIAGGCLLAFHMLSLRQDLSFKTSEGKIAFAIQFLPILILLGRSFWLYNIESILICCTSLVSFVAIRQIALSLQERSLLRIGLEVCSVILILMCSGTFGVTLLEFNLTEELILGLTTLLAAGMSFEMSLRGGSRAVGYRVMGTLILVSGLLLNFFVFESLLSAMLLLVVGASMMVGSFVFQQKALFIGSLCLISVGMYYQVTHLIALFEFNYWLALVGLGIVSIVSGSYLEANANRIKQWLVNNKQRLGEWEF